MEVSVQWLGLSALGLDLRQGGKVETGSRNGMAIERGD